jgi:hypothetical protein
MHVAILQPNELSRFHREFYVPNRPVVLRGLGELKPLRIFEWSAEYFREVMGAQRVPVLKTTTGFLSYERDVIEMPFDEFVARSFGGPKDPTLRYYYKNSVDRLPPGHDDSGEIEPLAPYIARAVMRNLWISGPGLTVGLHFDPAENFNFQLRGEKLFTLYPPGVRAYYPMPMFSQTAHISRVYRGGPSPNLSDFPRFDPKQGIPVELRAGDVLYLPAYWWHQVESRGEENVNLNFWWLPSLRKQLRHPNQALRGHVQVLLRYAKFGNLQKAPPATRTPGAAA